MLELARFEDRDSINSMARQVHGMHVAWRPDIYAMTDELYTLERFQTAIQERTLYTAKLEGIAVGYVSLKIRTYDWAGMVKRKVMFIDELCVEESIRRKGIGTQIMADVRALAGVYGCTDLQLGVYPQNDDAVAFYQKCGFTIRSIDMHRKV